jgi:hypothetical protein
LAKLCKDEGLDGPHYNNGKVQVDGVTFRAPGQIQDESGELVTTFFSGRGGGGCEVFKLDRRHACFRLLLSCTLKIKIHYQSFCDHSRNFALVNSMF